MTQPNFNFSDDLEQIRERQMAVLEEIDAIRERNGTLSPEIDRIQANALAIVYEIDEIKKRHGLNGGSI